MFFQLTKIQSEILYTRELILTYVHKLYIANSH